MNGTTKRVRCEGSITLVAADNNTVSGWNVRTTAVCPLCNQRKPLIIGQKGRYFGNHTMPVQPEPTPPAMTPEEIADDEGMHASIAAAEIRNEQALAGGEYVDDEPTPEPTKPVGSLLGQAALAVLGTLPAVDGSLNAQALCDAQALVARVAELEADRSGLAFDLRAAKVELGIRTQQLGLVSRSLAELTLAADSMLVGWMSLNLDLSTDMRRSTSKAATHLSVQIDAVRTKGGAR